MPDSPQSLMASGFASSSLTDMLAVKIGCYSDNLLTTSDNLQKVANPLYIGVLTTLQPFLKKSPCIAIFHQCLFVAVNAYG